MTYLDRFKREHPTLDADYIMDMYCPDDKLVSMICEGTDGLPECRKCWLRQVPDDDITVAGPVYEPDAGLSETGPDRT